MQHRSRVDRHGRPQGHRRVLSYSAREEAHHAKTRATPRSTARNACLAHSPEVKSQSSKRSSKGKRRCAREARLGGFAAALKVRKGGRGGDRTGDPCLQRRERLRATLPSSAATPPRSHGAVTIGNT